MSKKKITIYRPDWLVPETSRHDSCLLAEDGKMCCLGQFARQNGIKKQKMLNTTSPWDLVFYQSSGSTKRKYGNIFRGLLSENDPSSYHTFVGSTLMAINDAAVGEYYRRYHKNGETKEFKIRSQKHKEQLITKEFAKIGIEVSFVGELDLLPEHAKK